jgi:hypothetical protein
MKQNKTEPYQVCFLSTYDNVIKDKDRIKRNTLISGEINRFLPACLFSVWWCFVISLYNTVIVGDIVITK